MRKNSTQINEVARLALDITRDEYALCSYVQYRQADRRVKAGWCADPKHELAEFVGITRPGLYKMIDRLCGKDLLHIDAGTGHLQVTGKWIDTENDKKSVNKVYTDKKQSLHASVNKVDTDCKLSLQHSVNLVTPNIEVEYDNKKDKSESEHAPAQPEISSDLNTELKKALTPNSAGPLPQLPPNWAARPKAHTADELRAELANFYRPYPEQWRATIDGTPAVNWPADKTKDVVENFCAWAIGEGYNGRTFQQINARLKRWFRDEPIMSRQQAPTPANASPTLPKTMKVYGS